MKRTMPTEVRSAQAAFAAGKITRQERDRQLSAVAARDTESAGLRTAAGVETRIVGSRPKIGKA